MQHLVQHAVAWESILPQDVQHLSLSPSCVVRHLLKSLQSSTCTMVVYNGIILQYIIHTIYLCSHTMVPAGLVLHSHTQSIRQKNWLCVLAPLSELCKVQMIRKIAQQRVTATP